MPILNRSTTGDTFPATGFVSGFLVFALTLASADCCRAGTDEADTMAALRQLIERQNQKIDALNTKVRQLEEKEERREAAPETHLPTIVIDTNGVPLGTVAVVEAAPPKAMPEI